MHSIARHLRVDTALNYRSLCVRLARHFRVDNATKLISQIIVFHSPFSRFSRSVTKSPNTYPVCHTHRIVNITNVSLYTRLNCHKQRPPGLQLSSNFTPTRKLDASSQLLLLFSPAKQRPFYGLPPLLAFGSESKSNENIPIKGLT